MTEQEKLRKEFDDFCNHENSCLFEVKKRTNVFEWFWKHLEQRESDFKASLREEIQKTMDGFGTGTATFQTYKDVLQLLDTVKPKQDMRVAVLTPLKQARSHSSGTIKRVLDSITPEEQAETERKMLSGEPGNEAKEEPLKNTDYDLPELIRLRDECYAQAKMYQHEIDRLKHLK